MNDNKPLVYQDAIDDGCSGRFELNHEQYEGFLKGYMAAAEKANAKIAELEEIIAHQGKHILIQADRIAPLKSEIKKLREERDRFAIDFAKHFYLLTPTQRCTVHPPAGGGAGYGLYQRDISDILEQFKQQSK